LSSTGATDSGTARLYRWHVPRPRLTRVIDESAAQVVLLVAPAGYGKTTVAQEWVAGKPFAWYRPTAASADLAAFAAELAGAASTIVPHAGGRLAVRLQEGPLGAAAAADLLAADLGDWPPDAWLVIDDYHHAQTPAVDAFLDRLLERTSVRLLVATRSRPAWATARRQVYGGLVELVDDQLAMTRAEAARVLDGRARETTRQLVDRAAGWPALIGLAAIAASTELPPGRIARALYLYLATEVLEQRSPEESLFMLRASVPFQIDADTVQGPLEVEDAERLIESLAADSILHEAGDGAYRFHPLLRDFLRRRLMSEDHALFTRVAAALATVARADGRWEEGVELALDAGDVEAAAAIVGEGARALFAHGRIETVERWIARCAGATGDAAFAVARAELAMRRGRVREGQEDLVMLARTLGDAHRSSARIWGNIAWGHEHFSRHEEAVGAALRAIDASRDSVERLDTLYLAVRLAGEGRPALLPELIAKLEAEPPTPAMQATLTIARMFAGIHGRDLSGLSELVEANLRATSSAQPRLRLRMCLGAAYLALSRGDHRRSRETARMAIAIIEEFHFDGVVAALRYVDLANAHTGLREFRAAERALQQAERIAPGEVAWFAWERSTASAKLQLARQELVAVADGATAAPEANIPAHRQAEQAGLRAIAAAALGRRDQATEEIAAAGIGRQAIEAHFYARFAEAIMDESRTIEVVADAFRSDFHDACTVAYRAYPPLLAAAAAERSLRAELTRLVLGANDHVLGRSAGLLPETHAGEPGRPTLTPREAEVMLLLTEGLSNQEIAAHLYIAHSTAKVHVRHILDKLGVSNRTQAVVRAQRLPLA
jgi:LuxR family transcriptional regulator, maltose regulon positive regulatory protein